MPLKKKERIKITNEFLHRDDTLFVKSQPIYLFNSFSGEMIFWREKNNLFMSFTLTSKKNPIQFTDSHIHIKNNNNNTYTYSLYLQQFW